MEPGRWDVAIRRGAVETGGEAERGGRRESRRNAPAPWVERAPWVFVKAREHLPPVWQLLSPPPYFSYRSLFALQTVPPVFFTSFARCLSLCSWQVTSIRHVPLMKPKLTHVLHFGGCVRRRVRDLGQDTHSRDIRYAHVRLFRNSLLISIMQFLFILEQDLFLPHESWREICLPTNFMFTLKKVLHKPKRFCYQMS